MSIPNSFWHQNSRPGPGRWPAGSLVSWLLSKRANQIDIHGDGQRCGCWRQSSYAYGNLFCMGRVSRILRRLNCWCLPKKTSVLIIYENFCAAASYFIWIPIKMNGWCPFELLSSRPMHKVAINIVTNGEKCNHLPKVLGENITTQYLIRKSVWPWHTLLQTPGNSNIPEIMHQYLHRKEIH